MAVESPIILATLNAKYIHTAFGLRYLLANMGELESRTRILEFEITQRPIDIVETLLDANPRIIGLGIYIWNASQSLEVITLLKRIRPEIIVILGGPEVSFELEQQTAVQLADYVIPGEADLKFPELCRRILEGCPPQGKVVPSELPILDKIKLPYHLYTDADIAHRMIYVEASRGCPFTCEFCLSSLDVPVRQFALPDLLYHFERLLDRGAKHFKFVDRTFNLNLNLSTRLLEFFHSKYRPGLFLHFEMIPDRLPEALRERIARFPPGALQFEVGIQTFDEEVAARIRRRQNYEKIADNFRFLREETGVYIHADLIAGLPGETLESFAAGFDRLVALRPQEIQVGILKRLRGTPIVRHDTEWEMVYDPHPPYEIVRTKTMDFKTLQQIRRFSRFWDLVSNSGNFVESAPLIWEGCPSAFEAFNRFVDWIYAKAGRKHGIALVQLAEWLFEFLIRERGIDPCAAARALWNDYRRGGRSDKPVFLRPYLPDEGGELAKMRPVKSGPKRQARHYAARP